MRILAFVVVLGIWGTSALAENKVPLVRWSTADGVKRLSDSQHKVDFFKLANQYQAQQNKIACGPTSAAIVLNALRLNKKGKSKPFTKFDESFRKNTGKFEPRMSRYTPDNFFNSRTDKVKSAAQVYGEPIKGKKDFGIQIRQLHNLFVAHKAQSKLQVMKSSVDFKKVKKAMIKNLSEENNYVVVNYYRKSLGQKGGGHISPVGAYDQNSKSFLVMDVNPSKDEWVWVNEDDLLRAMQTKDTVENRGFLLVSDQ